MLKTVLLAFLGLSGLSPSAAAADQDVIDSDTYFYGQSPPVYPSRESDLPALVDCMYGAANLVSSNVWPRRMERIIRKSKSPRVKNDH